MKSKKVLYISYDGICEPLGQSQVISYLMELSKNWQIELMSFEKPSDISMPEKIQHVQNQCNEYDIQWTYFQYHKSPTLLATLYNVLQAWLYILRKGKSEYNIIHCRSYVAMFMAVVAKILFRTSVVFDMRGFWADEKVDSGTWRRGALYHTVKSLESYFLKSADSVISLTHKAVDEILSWPTSKKLKADKFHVISTCVSTEKFKWSEQFPEDLCFGYVGGTQLWYDFPKVLGFYNAFLLKFPKARLHIVNKAEHEYIQKCLQFAEVPLDNVTLESREHYQMEEVYRKFSFGVFFIRDFYSKKASMPTKLAEFMASGTPVITGRGIGDVDHYINAYRTGVLVGDELTSDDMHNVVSLLDDPEIRSRCRQMAEQEFSLKQAIQKIEGIYCQLSSQD